MPNTITDDIDDSDATVAKEMNLTPDQYRAEMRRRERNRVAKAAARRQQARTEMRGETMRRRIVIQNQNVEIDEGTYERLKEAAEANGKTVEEQVKILIDAGLLEADSDAASSTGANDPDNDSQRKLLKRPADKAAPPEPLKPISREERMQLIAKMQNLTFLGRAEEAKDLEKILAIYDRESGKQSEPSFEEERRNFADAIVRNGTSPHPSIYR
jgi:hypothetical protein